MNNGLWKNENLCNDVHRLNKNKADYFIKSMLQRLVASNFAEDRENVGRELCLNVFTPFHIMVCCFEAR